MKTAYSVLILATILGCGHVEPGHVFVPAEAKPDTCSSAFGVTEEAWDEAIGPVSSSCSSVDQTIMVEVTAPDDMPCKGAAACTVDGVMYVSESLSWHQAPSVAAHEWVHVLAECETGDPDAEHKRRDLWAGLDPEGVRGDTVEAIAVRAAPHGPCVGDPMGEPLP